MSKHTPGPWLLNLEQGYGINTTTKHIALVSYYQTKRGDREENKANAHLIAAAPEMLEALKYYFDVLKEVNGSDWDKKPDHVLLKMLNAINKAEGKL